jgi:hypothetical protein
LEAGGDMSVNSQKFLSLVYFFLKSLINIIDEAETQMEDKI